MKLKSSTLAMGIMALVLVLSSKGQAGINPSASEEILENEIWCGVKDPSRKNSSNIYMAPTSSLSDGFRTAMGQVITPKAIVPFSDVVAECWANTHTFSCNLNIHNVETKLVIDLTSLRLEFAQPGTQSSTGIERVFKAKAKYLGMQAECNFGNRRANEVDFAPRAN